MKAQKVYENILNEAYEPKDLKRIQDFSKKSEGVFDREVSLAQQMAKTLKNIDKAIGRAEAAAEVYGGWNEIVEIFYNKAKELGYVGPPPAERLKILKEKPILGSKLSANKKYKRSYKKINYWKGNPILPIGKVDLRSGESKYFNVYDTWNNEGTVEVWRDNKGINTKYLDTDKYKEPTGIGNILKPKSKEEIERQKRQYFNYKLIFTSGDKPLHEIGEKRSFYHDQNGNIIGNWEMVDYVPLEYMRELILPYGKKLSGYVYK